MFVNSCVFQVLFRKSQLYFEYFDLLREFDFLAVCIFILTVFCLFKPTINKGTYPIKKLTFTTK